MDSTAENTPTTVEMADIQVLCYRWEFMRQGRWTPLSYHECQQIEKCFIRQSLPKCVLNATTKAIKTPQGTYKLLDDEHGVKHDLCRRDRFNGKVMHIDQHNRSGHVESNFPGHKLGIGFFFSDCSANVSAHALKKGDVLEYAIGFEAKKQQYRAFDIVVVQHNANPSGGKDKKQQRCKNGMKCRFLAKGRCSFDHSPQTGPVCKRCNLTLNSQQQWDSHLTSRKHLNQVRNVGKPAPSSKQKHKRCLDDVECKYLLRGHCHLECKYHHWI